MDSIMFKKGEIYLATLNPKKGNEVGKLRPVLIYQTDILNEIFKNIKLQRSNNSN